MSNASIATKCLHAWTRGDFAAARALLADDVEFVGPLGTTKGGDAYIEGVRGFAKTIDRAEERAVVESGDDVVVIYDLVPKQGEAVPTAGWYIVRGGKIAFVRAYFDPRPLVQHK